MSLLSNRDWTAEDTYTVHFRTRNGVDGVMQSSAGSWGTPLAATRIAGSKGTLLVEGNDVFVADGTGQRKLDVPADLELPAPLPPVPNTLPRFSAILSTISTTARMAELDPISRSRACSFSGFSSGS